MDQDVAELFEKAKMRYGTVLSHQILSLGWFFVCTSVQRLYVLTTHTSVVVLLDVAAVAPKSVRLHLVAYWTE
jgi:hypothetical protein